MLETFKKIVLFVGQRSHSDPGAEDPPVLNKGVKEHFLGEDGNKHTHSSTLSPAMCSSPRNDYKMCNLCQYSVKHINPQLSPTLIII